jgi:hypothetical protein
LDYVAFHADPMSLDRDWISLLLPVLGLGLAIVAFQGRFRVLLPKIAQNPWRSLAWTWVAIVLGCTAETLPPEEKLAEALAPEQTPAEAPPPVEPAAAEKENPKPEWVGMRPERIGNLYRTTASAGPFSTDDECYRNINREIEAVVCKYVDELLGLGNPDAGLRPWRSSRAVSSRLEPLNVNSRYIRDRLWRDQYVEFVDSSVDRIASGSSFGKMRTLHVLLEFDDKVQDDLRSRWQKSQLTARLTLVGISWASLLALLGVAFACLRIDTATNGNYSVRLRMAAGVATILLAGVIVFLILWS